MSSKNFEFYLDNKKVICDQKISSPIKMSKKFLIIIKIIDKF